MAINNNNAIIEYNTVNSGEGGVVTLVAEHGNRVGLQIYNAAGTNNLYVRWTGDASTDDYAFKLVAGALYEMPLSYTTAKLTGIWDGDGQGVAKVTEIRDT